MAIFMFFYGFRLDFDPIVLISESGSWIDAQLCPVFDYFMTISISNLSSGTIFGDRGFLPPQQNRRGQITNAASWPMLRDLLAI